LRIASISHFLCVLSVLASATLVGCGGVGGGGGTSSTTGTDGDSAVVQNGPAAQAPEDAALRARIADASFTVLSVPATSPPLVVLGRALMFDKILSGNRDVACATCHDPDTHTGDGLSLSIGTGGTGGGAARQQGTGQHGQGTLPFIARNAPDLFNRGLPQWRTMFWDSRVSGSAANGFDTPAGNALPGGLDSVLAAQAMFPVMNRAEMRGEVGDVDVNGQANELALIDDSDEAAIWQGIMARVLGIPEYRDLFAAAYPGVAQADLGFQHAANAIAAFETAAFTGFSSPFDRYVAGEDNALNAQEKRGATLFFGRARCADCHSGPLLTDQASHSVGMAQIGPGHGTEAPQDFGREAETGNANQRYAFRTAPLRNVALTAPYFHDGAFTTLEAAVRHYDNPAQSLASFNPAPLDDRLENTFLSDGAIIAAIQDSIDRRLPGIRLNNQDVADLAAFLRALTDPRFEDQSGVEPDRVPSGLPVD